MGSSERVRRPVLQRSEPIRRWSTLFEAPRPESEDPAPEAAPPPRGASLNDVVSRSVDLGYRVIDDYIRQGQKAAQRLSDRTYGIESATTDLQDLAARMTRYASDLISVWLELIQLASAGTVDARQRAPAAAEPAAAGGDPVDAAADVDARTHVKVEIVSSQPTEVSLDLRAGATRRPVVVHALRAVDADRPRLTEVELHPALDDAPAQLRLRVPPAHPPGVYCGLIIDAETSRPVGTLSVTLAPA